MRRTYGLDGHQTFVSQLETGSIRKLRRLSAGEVVQVRSLEVVSKLTLTYRYFSFPVQQSFAEGNLSICPSRQSRPFKSDLSSWCLSDTKGKLLTSTQLKHAIGCAMLRGCLAAIAAVASYEGMY